MPGISQGYSMAAHANIERAIRDTYSDPKMLEDAFRVLELTNKAHVWEDRMLESQIEVVRFMFRILSVVILVANISILFKDPTPFFVEMFPVWTLFYIVVALTVLESRWSAKRIQKAKDELDSLCKSKPEYWEPLIERVVQIAINYGNAEHSLFGSRQVTVLKNEKS